MSMEMGRRGRARMVFVTLDLIHVPRELREGVERAAAARYQLGAASILLNASHTHSAPAPYGYGVPDTGYARKGTDRLSRGFFLSAAPLAL